MVGACEECGSEFEMMVVELFGRTIKRRFCEECVQKHIREEELKNSKPVSDKWGLICPPLYRNTDPALLPQDALKKALAWRYGARGLIIQGHSGVGKTRIMFQLLKQLHDGGYEISFFNSVTFGAGGQTAAMAGNTHDWVRETGLKQVFVFDDLGQMKMTATREEMLLSVIEFRVSHELPILVTTQYAGEDFVKQFDQPERGRAVYRRLKEFCQLIQVRKAV